MKNDDLRRISKRLARYLRHDPGRLGIALDRAGWVDVDTLLAALRHHGTPITRADLDEVVRRNDKRRFAFDPTGSRIRANQGHTVAVDLGLPAASPSPLLYHGTVERFLPAILEHGLRPMGRHHVHLSTTPETARTVGRRRGVPVVLVVAAAAMACDGHEFHVSANGVWLTSEVPPRYLRRR